MSRIVFSALAVGPRDEGRVQSMYLTVGKRLRELRERVGISQRELARRSGQSPASVSAIELNKVSPSIETLKNLLDALDETLANFFSVGTEASAQPFFGPENMVEIRLGPIHYQQVGQSFMRDGVQIVRTRGASGLGHRQGQPSGPGWRDRVRPQGPDRGHDQRQQPRPRRGPRLRHQGR